MLEKAEALLQHTSLLDYYDDVMLPALTRGSDDEARGMLISARVVTMTRSLRQVLSDLNDVAGLDAKGPPPSPDTGGPLDTPESTVSASDGPVVCVAGRGPFDDAVSTMMCQLLTRRGVQARVVTHDDVSRERVGQLDLRDVKVIVLSYLDMSDSTSHLRYLVRRLRQHAPGVRIIVGLWHAGDQVEDAARRQAVGADAYVGSLRQTLEWVHGQASGARRHSPGERSRPLYLRIVSMRRRVSCCERHLYCLCSCCLRSRWLPSQQNRA